MAPRLLAPMKHIPSNKFARFLDDMHANSIPTYVCTLSQKLKLTFFKTNIHPTLHPVMAFDTIFNEPFLTRPPLTLFLSQHLDPCGNKTKVKYNNFEEEVRKERQRQCPQCTTQVIENGRPFNDTPAGSR